MALAMPTNQPELPDHVRRRDLRVIRSGKVAINQGQTVTIGSLPLERGGVLPVVEIRYRTWGTLDETGHNAVLVLHALTGDSNAAGDGGWWEPLIGPGRAIDTDRYFVICSNIIGGCQAAPARPRSTPAPAAPMPCASRLSRSATWSMPSAG